jgi:hypothetical protein
LKHDTALSQTFDVSVFSDRKPCSKLDQHYFTFVGILIGYTATDENIGYIDVSSRLVQTSYHAIFDETWYLQPQQPPFAQMAPELAVR